MGLIEQLLNSGIIKKMSPNSSPVTNNDLNNSPRPVDINQPRAIPFSGQGGTGSPADINQPRTAQFAGANINSNIYGKNEAEDFLKKIFVAKKGGEVLAKGNKLAKHRPTKLY